MSIRIVRGLTLITAPDLFPLTLEEVKQHLHVDHDDEDALIGIYLAAAVAHVEDKLQRSLMPQVWEMTLDTFPPHYSFAAASDEARRALGTIEIPRPPLISVDRIRYIDADGNEQEIGADNYTVDLTRSPGFVVPIDGYTWPTPLEGANKVIIRFTAGYPDTDGLSGSSAGVNSTVPQPVRVAILMIVADLFAHRESVSDRSPSSIPVPATVNALLNPYRIFALA